MAKQPRTTKPKPKRKGTAFWLSDQDGDLLRAIARAEDRTLQAVIRRALAAYAEGSVEYGKKARAK